MRYYLPQRYLTYRKGQRSAGLFAVGDIIDRRGRSVFPAYTAKPAALVKALRSGRFRFDIYVCGRKPAADVWLGQYLLVDPVIARRHLKEFLPQIDAIAVEAVDREGGRSYRMLLLNPLHHVDAFVAAIELDLKKDPGALKRTIAWTEEGAATCFQLAEEVLRPHDFVLVANSPVKKLAVSERLKRALRRGLPKVRLIDFKEYCLVQRRAAGS
jgi:hypothetical protein